MIEDTYYSCYYEWDTADRFYVVEWHGMRQVWGCYNYDI